MISLCYCSIIWFPSISIFIYLTTLLFYSGLMHHLSMVVAVTHPSTSGSSLLCLILVSIIVYTNFMVGLSNFILSICSCLLNFCLCPLGFQLSSQRFGSMIFLFRFHPSLLNFILFSCFYLIQLCSYWLID